MGADPDSEILIEMNRMGGSVEVRAVSAGDGLEVVFVVPSKTAEADIEKLARAKLTYVRGKERLPGAGPKKPDGRGGLIA